MVEQSTIDDFQVESTVTGKVIVSKGPRKYSPDSFVAVERRAGKVTRCRTGLPTSPENPGTSGYED